MRYLIIVLLFFINNLIFSLPFSRLVFISEYQIATTLGEPLFFIDEYYSDKDKSPFELGVSEVTIMGGETYIMTVNNYTPQGKLSDKSFLEGTYTTNYDELKLIESYSELGEYNFYIIFKNQYYIQKYIFNMYSDGVIKYSTNHSYPANTGTYNSNEIILVEVGKIRYEE